jgi:acyl-CoA reductase-like NAD-dependent aldehyde dehydrogenase
MGRLTEQQVERIAGSLATRLAPGAPGALAIRRAPGSSSLAGEGQGPGLFPDVESAVAAARLAFERLSGESLALRDRIIATMRERLLPEAEPLARLAREETGLGRYDDKVLKNRLVIRKTPGTEALRPEALTGDRGLTLCERAPFGVIAAITPVTNPTSTIIGNAIAMLAAGNSVVFNVHPHARRVGNRTVNLINEAIMAAGGPVNLVTAVAEPTIETAQALMRHPRVRLLVVTGGAGVVREAMASGKRAICAGPGNPPVVVDETADLERAARDIVLGASFDNNIVCVCEKEVFVVATVADALLAAMQRHGAHLLAATRCADLERTIFAEVRGPRQPGVVRPELIGQDPAVILERLGVRAGTDTRLIVVDVEPPHPLVWTEQMMPVLPVVRVGSADQAIDLAIAAERGFGHTAVMHSRHIDHLSRMAREINCSIFVKNGPCYAGLGEGGEGHSSFTIASPTGEGMTGPLSFSRERRCVMVDHFRIV